MDALSHVLDAVRLRAGIFARASLLGDWALTYPGSEDAVFHVVMRGYGELWVGDDASPFGPGDLLLLPHGVPHTLRTGAAEPVICSPPPDPDAVEQVAFLHYGESGEEVRLLSGTFTLHEAAARFVLGGQPDAFVVQPARLVAAWLDHALGTLAGANGSRVAIGGAGSTRRLAEILVVHLFAEIVRLEQGTGWLAALGDNALEGAVTAMHAEPTTEWTMDTLAAAAGLDRAAFGRQFLAVTGAAPLSYLTDWRMVLARVALAEGSSVSEAAHRAGYSSRAAFTKAFERHVGTTPIVWARRIDRQRRPPEPPVPV